MNQNARFDLRVSGGYSLEKDTPIIRISGEVSGSLLEREGIQDHISDIVIHHYNRVHQTSLTAKDILIEYEFKPQTDKLALNGFAGDSGNPIAVAYKDAPHNLPWERFLTVGIRDLIDEIYQNKGKVPDSIAHTTGVDRMEGLRADGKVEVDAEYRGASLERIAHITVAAEHEEKLPLEQLQSQLGRVIRAYLQGIESQHNASFGNPSMTINGNGAWHEGGWKADEGSREAKPYRDGFATYGVNEDSFSGEDPSKPSATGTFLARYIANQIVRKGVADFARVSLTYTIGKDEVGLNVTTNGTARVSQDEIEGWVRENIPLCIKDAINGFGLKNPSLYRQIVAASDFFHDPTLPWNGGKVFGEKMYEAPLLHSTRPGSGG